MNCVDSTLVPYLAQISKVPLLSREEEFETAVKARKGDRKAKQKLILANLRFVVQTAKRYSNCGLPIEDLISEGNIGLIRSVESFEPERGFHFISYAVYWIKQSIIKAISEKSKIVRLPLNLNNNLAAIERNLQENKLDEINDDSLEKISKEISMNKKDIIKLVAVTRKPTSLDKTVGSSANGKAVRDFIPDERPSPQEEAIGNSLRENLIDSLQFLKENEAEIIKERFGIIGNEPKTLLEIGKKQGLTKERIRQLEKQALDKLKQLLSARDLQIYVA